MFVGFWPKKRNEMPSDNLRKLVAAFDTIEDFARAMKCMSVKQGVEGAIALAQSHGEEVDWEKVGASYAVPLAKMTEFFKKAKEYAPSWCPLSSLRQLPRLLQLGLRRLLLVPLLMMCLRLLLPRILLPRWHRFLACLHRF
jgi:hypothetical protein